MGCRVPLLCNAGGGRATDASCNPNNLPHHNKIHQMPHTTPTHFTPPHPPHQSTKDKTGQTWDAARDALLTNWRAGTERWDDAMARAWDEWQVGLRG